MKIGVFALDKKGIMQGKIFGLGLVTTPVIFEPQTSRDGKDYSRLIADPAKEAYEIGVAFPKEKDGMVYHSVIIESPVLPTPINAALFPDKDNESKFNLVWNRPEPQGLKAEATVSVNGHSQSRRVTGSPRPML